MARCYRIRNWDRLFETSESRKRVNLPWVAIPTKHDGKGYRRLMREFGPAVYGAWILIVAVAAKCPTRGTLADADGPLSALDLADKTDCPVEVIEQALVGLTNERIGWLEIVNLPESQQILIKSAGVAADSAVVPARPAATPVLPDQTRQNQTEPDITKPVPVPDTGTGARAGSGNGRAGTGVSAKRKEHDWGPSAFHGLVREDLVQSEILDRWFAWATTKAKSPLCRLSGGHSEQNRLRVFGAAERAIEEGEDPIKLFKHIVGGEHWKLITHAQEDRAIIRIKRLNQPLLHSP